MATQVSSRNACWLDGITVTGQDMRLQIASGMLTSTGAAGTTGIAATAGVRYSVGAPLACVWQSGMGFNLNAGVCWVQGTVSATSGLWSLVLDTTTLLTVTASDPTNPRIDSVIAVVVDNGNGTSTSVFKILPGTPAGSPVAPTLPANALRLWNISVAANAVVLSQVNFTDVRVWTGMAGGILPFANAALGTTVGGPTGAYVDDLNTGRLRRLDSSGNARQAKTVAFAPTETSVGSTTMTGSDVTVASLSITPDGVTEIQMLARWNSFTPSAPIAGNSLTMKITVDGATQESQFQNVANTSTNPGNGGVLVTFGTLSAVSHTIAFVVNAPNNYVLANAKLRISAVPG